MAPTRLKEMEQVTIWNDGGEEIVSPEEFIHRIDSFQLATGALVRIGDHGKFMPADEAVAVIRSGRSDGRTQPPILVNTRSLTNRESLQAILIVGAILFVISAAITVMLHIEAAPEKPEVVDPATEIATAYSEATNFLRNEFAGPLTMSPLNESRINRNGKDWEVSLKVDGLNVFGGPVRRWVTVELRGSGRSIWASRVVDKASAARSIQ